MGQEAQKIVSEITSDLKVGMLPDSVIQTIERQKQNMIALACALHASGKHENDIKNILETSFSSFRNELSNTLGLLKESGQI